MIPSDFFFEWCHIKIFFKKVFFEVSIHGSRKLWQLHGDPKLNKNFPQSIEQTGGNFYITTPFGIVHAPQYPTIKEENYSSHRVLALQCRILLSLEESKKVTFYFLFLF